MRVIPSYASLYVCVSLATAFLSGTSDSALAFFRPIDKTYRVVFEDDFSDPTIDATRWTKNWWGCPTCVTPPLQPGNEIAALDPQQASVVNGSARLKLISSPVTVNGVRYPNRSGILHTAGKAHFTYGYFEARIWLSANTLNGQIANWPAFIGDGQKWPYDGENDIMEGLGPTLGVACYHYHSAAGETGACSKQNMSGWHTYAALWEPGKITYYYDGVSLGAITSNIQASPMYLILVYGASKIHGGPVAVPGQMAIDYVRVWQKQ